MAFVNLTPTTRAPQCPCGPGESASRIGHPTAPVTSAQPLPPRPNLPRALPAGAVERRLDRQAARIETRGRGGEALAGPTAGGDRWLSTNCETKSLPYCPYTGANHGVRFRRSRTHNLDLQAPPPGGVTPLSIGISQEERLATRRPERHNETVPGATITPMQPAPSKADPVKTPRAIQPYLVLGGLLALAGMIFGSRGGGGQVERTAPSTP